MKFINIPEGKIGRFEIGVTPVDIGGLYTDDFTSCNIVILKGSKRFSLLHVDFSITSDQIENEIKWINDNEWEGYILKREDFSNAFINISPELKHKFKVHPIGENVEGILTTRSCAVKANNRENIPALLLRHPEEQKITRFHRLNQYLVDCFCTEFYPFDPKKNIEHPNPIIFNGQIWTNYQ